MERMPRSRSPRRSLRWRFGCVFASALAFGFAPHALQSSAPSASAPAAESLPDASRELEDSAVAQARLVDRFHPANQPGANGQRPAAPVPAYGGRAIVHLTNLPASLNPVLDNSSVTRRMLQEMHETLLRRDPETLALEPNLCSGYVAEDALVLVPEARERWSAHALELRPEFVDPGKASSAPVSAPSFVLCGRASASADGWTLEHANGERLNVPAADVRSCERGTVFTFELRPDVRWQDGHPLDVHDLRFSWELFWNPHLKANERRYAFTKIRRCDVLDERRVRFVYEQQYFKALEAIAIDLPLLPRHLYDLTDPDCAQHAAGATLEQQARHIAEHPANLIWVGLGPYRVTRFDQQWIEAERWDGYFDPERGGYLDALRWRYIPDDQAVVQALLSGELDFTDRLRTEDYFGAATTREAFTRRLYKGVYYAGGYGLVFWNMHRPQFAQLEVRRALAQVTDLDAWLRSYYRGLGVIVTGPQNIVSDGYDRTLPRLPYDPRRAAERMLEAGWYDRDGDGIADREGARFEFEMLVPTGNDPAQRFAIKFQEDIAQLGGRMRITELEWAAMRARIDRRDFDAANMAWIPPEESDLEQGYHSRWGGADVLNTANYAGLMDARVDDLIERGQRELDPARRHALWRELHARIYELQPALYMVNPPRKFALSLALRGFQAVRVDPNYVLRRWHYAAGTPGTRPRRERTDKAE